MPAAAKEPATAKATPRISVIERRLQGPSVFRTSSAPIAMKDPAWICRWENADIGTNHMFHVVHDLGWEYAAPEDVESPIDEIGATVLDRRVVRGDKGREVLMKMRAKDYAAIQQRKSEENEKQTFGTKQVKEAIVAGVGNAHGDEAAAFVSRNVNTITVRDSRVVED